MNVVVIVGRLTKRPELRKTASGLSVVNFNVAVDRFNSDDADFPSVIAYGKIADNMCKYLERGSKVGVKGRIQTRSYDNQHGTKVYVTEVVADEVEFLESKKEKQEEPVIKKQPKIDDPFVKLKDEVGVSIDDLPF